MEKNIDEAYPILFSDHIYDLKDALESYRSGKMFVIIDENTKKYCLPLLAEIQLELIPIEIKSGEKNKILSTCEDIWSLLIEYQCNRSDFIINLGGGVIGDLGGFAAACFKRGIKFMQIPTTLLSMVDASVGGKLGINFRGLKNNIGLFCNPQLVYINPVFLKTLDHDQLKSGFSEMIKHALISSHDLWKNLKNINFKTMTLKNIKDSVSVKQNVVNKDFKEQNIRKTLNFGHTIGHAIESFSLKIDTKPISHGEAVAAGMIIELKISDLIFNLEHSLLKQLEDIVLELYGKYDIGKIPFDHLMKLMLQDKKNKSNEILFVLLKDIGNAVYDQKVTDKVIFQAVDYYKILKYK